MTESPRPNGPKEGQDKKPQPAASAVQAIVMTMLDTTWRIFVPPIAAVFIGIGLDHLFNIVPVATAVCLALGVGLSIFLVTKQLNRVRKSIKG